ncbi:MAG: hypothetical protein GXO86_15380 [Chlorobi bacterium]|nr:hypothetical protein [Chlorobiota bacterium]
MLDDYIENNEYLYRGIVKQLWDFENNRPSSAIYKDSKGVSVDRDAGRSERDCVIFLLDKRDFFAVGKVLTKDVRILNAVVKYLPVEHNIYHSEIHDSDNNVRLRGRKPARIRDKTIIIH